jgi:hypothetical protein
MFTIDIFYYAEPVRANSVRRRNFIRDGLLIYELVLLIYCSMRVMLQNVAKVLGDHLPLK